jgi:dihydrofolate synthase/folylpolyglutamate synthase
MTYLETIRYLGSFINYEKIPTWPYRESLKLERIKGFLESINNPQDSLRYIHIAGTKGKGSTCAFIAYILRQAGYRVGLYTSPHLSDFRERIRILNKRIVTPVGSQLNKEFEGMIGKRELINLVRELRPAIEKHKRSSQYGPLSFFEVYTSLAFVYFKKKNVDFVVLETGLGGRLDATNVINPAVCVITPISYEHTQKLGNTLREISIEKAGIIKTYQGNSSVDMSLSLSLPCRRAGGRQTRPRMVVITAPQRKEVIRVIKDKCKKKMVKLYEVGKDIQYKATNMGFKIKGIFAQYSHLKIRLLGDHQLLNAATAVGAIEALRFYDINIRDGSISGGLYNTIWPGRCEVISRDPLIVVDGAQNTASAQILKSAVRASFPNRRIILILGISKDKDILGICRQLIPICRQVILTQANNPRATDTDTMERAIKDCMPDMRCEIFKTRKVLEAVKLAKSQASKQDLILVSGSLFVVGEARADIFSQIA